MTFFTAAAIRRSFGIPENRQRNSLPLSHLIAHPGVFSTTGIMIIGV